MTGSTNRTRQGIFLSSAPWLFVLLWATGFIGAKLGIPYAEPMTFLAIRFAIVTVLLLLIVLAMRAPWPQGRALYGHLAVSGILVHGLYLGGVFAAINLGVSAGISALIVGIHPLLTAALVGPFLGERLSVRQWAGFLTGFAGVGLVVFRKFHLEQGSWIGFSLCIVAVLGITIGSVYQKRFCQKMDLRSGSMVQFFAAFVFCLVLALLLEKRSVSWTGEFIFALTWLCLVLSLGAMTLLWLLIRHGEASRVASLFYLVPPVAAIMGYLLFHETLTMMEVAGMGMAAVGVAMVRKPDADSLESCK